MYTGLVGEHPSILLPGTVRFGYKVSQKCTTHFPPALKHDDKTNRCASLVKWKWHLPLPNRHAEDSVCDPCAKRCDWPLSDADLTEPRELTE
jgi:hypothetical protein